MKPTFILRPSFSHVRFIPLYVKKVRRMTGFRNVKERGEKEVAHFSVGWKRKMSASLYARIMAGTGAALLLYLLLAPSDKGIPGWQPVNGSLRATLASGESPSVSSPLPTSAAKPAESAVPSPAESSDQVQTPTSNTGHAVLLDLNTATETELDGLPGIGPSKAKSILAYRDAHHGFRAVDELLQVKGIGAKLFEQLRPLVAVAPAKPAPG
jgi:competence protein ComEA